MSTKIYNAFRIRYTQINTVIEFLKELKIVYTEYMDAEHAAYMTDCLLNTSELYRFYENEDSDGFADRLLALTDILTFNRTQMPVSSISYDTAKDILSFGYCSRLELCRAYADSMIRTKHNDSEDPLFKASIAMFGRPAGKKDSHCLFMYFGTEFSHFMELVISGKTENINAWIPSISRLEKYGIEEYHYQNQTDRPDDISESKWEKRKDDWNSVMETGIPCQDAVIVELQTPEQFLDSLHFKYAENPDGIHASLLKNIRRKQDRLEAYAMDCAMQEYIRSEMEQSGNSGHNDVFYREFMKSMEAYKNNRSVKNKAVKLYKQYMKKIRPYMLDFSYDTMKDILMEKPYNLSP